MSTKRYEPEQIVNLLRQVEVVIANGKTTPQTAREVGICSSTIRARRRTNPRVNWGPNRSLEKT